MKLKINNVTLDINTQEDITIKVFGGVDGVTIKGLGFIDGRADREFFNRLNENTRISHMKGKKVPPKYIYEDKTWSGRGIAPKWVQELRDLGVLGSYRVR